MATVEITRRALADLERLFDFIATENPRKAREQILSVRKAFELLPDHPLLGRPAEEGRRELVLSRGRYGISRSTAGSRPKTSCLLLPFDTSLRRDTLASEPP